MDPRGLRARLTGAGCTSCGATVPVERIVVLADGAVDGVTGTDGYSASDFDSGTINNATFAVTVEPAGGSPTGQPTSAPIFTGKLIETVPAR